jgi:hypothetical protein
VLEELLQKVCSPLVHNVFQIKVNNLKEKTKIIYHLLMIELRCKGFFKKFINVIFDFEVVLKPMEE